MESPRSAHDPATELFTDAMVRWVRGFGTVFGFRQSMTRLLAVGPAVLSPYHQRIAQELTTDPSWTGIWKDLSGIADPEFQATLARQFTASAVQTAKGGIDSACVVFAHSVVDAAAFDYCKATALAAPQDWEPDLLQRQAQLTEIKARTFAEIFQDRLSKYLQDLEKESLAKKLDRLHARCSPPAGWKGLRDFRYDPGRLDAFDRLRQRIAHGDAMGQEVPGLDDELHYVNLTCAYMMALVNERYDLRVDLARWTARMAGGGS